MYVRRRESDTMTSRKSGIEEEEREVEGEGEREGEGKRGGEEA